MVSPRRRGKGKRPALARKEISARYYAAHKHERFWTRYMARIDKRKQEQREAFGAWMAFLKSFPCTDCGGTFHPEAMEFDHVRGAKTKAISCMQDAGRASLFAELQKCELVCANCHRVRTYERRHGVA